MQNNKAKLSTIYIVRIALIAALLTALKFALSFVPNIEIVTLLIIVFSSSFGMAYSLPSVIIFCLMEMAIYGFNSWVILYFIFWPLLAVFSSLLLRKKNVVVAVILSVIFSILFGVLSACADTLFCIGNIAKERLGEYFIAYYLRGLTFDLIHIISNFVIVMVLYLPLVSVCKRVMPIQYGSRELKTHTMLKCDIEYKREILSDVDNE